MAHGPAASDRAARRPLTLHGLSVEGVNRCVHCGLCLAYCPTFSELGTEMDSPRGRIFLIKSLAEGRIGLSDSTVQHLDLCLGCRACETVCPSGVPYGQLIEAARAEIERQRPGGPVRRVFRWLNFALLLPHPRVLRSPPRACASIRPAACRGSSARAVCSVCCPGRSPAWEPCCPTLPAAAERAPLPELTAAEGPERARVGLLTGCIQQVVFGAQTAPPRACWRNGVEVVAPRAQACCGALHAHAGEHATRSTSPSAPSRRSRPRGSSRSS